MAFIENWIGGAPANWWAPNHARVIAMQGSSDVEVSARTADETYLCIPGEDGKANPMIAAELDAATGRP